MYGFKRLRLPFLPASSMPNVSSSHGLRDISTSWIISAR